MNIVKNLDIKNVTYLHMAKIRMDSTMPVNNLLKKECCKIFMDVHFLYEGNDSDLYGEPPLYLIMSGSDMVSKTTGEGDSCHKDYFKLSDDGTIHPCEYNEIPSGTVVSGMFYEVASATL